MHVSKTKSEETQEASASQIANETVNQDQADSTVQILSSMPLSGWKGSITTFKGFTGTRPDLELNDATWHEVVQVAAPEEPTVLSDKRQGTFFVPCALQEARLVGYTLEAATKSGRPTTGKMRSKQHVTEATMLVIDVDGLTPLDFWAGLEKIKGDGLTILYYTTYSHGSVEKPGTRARIVIPLDRSINIEEYAAAWYGFDQHYWDGKAGQADSSGANLYQQQGAWCCHPDRDENAIAKDTQRGVASADALIALGRMVFPARSIRPASTSKPVSQISIQPKGGRRSTNEADHCDETKMCLLRTLLNYIDPDSAYGVWLSVGMALHFETAGGDDGLALFDEWSSRGDKYKGDTETGKKWHSFRSPPGASYTIATLFWMVKKEGVSKEMISAEAERFETIGGDQDAA